MQTQKEQIIPFNHWCMGKYSHFKWTAEHGALYGYLSKCWSVYCNSCIYYWIYDKYKCKTATSRTIFKARKAAQVHKCATYQIKPNNKQVSQMSTLLLYTYINSWLFLKNTDFRMILFISKQLHPPASRMRSPIVLSVLSCVVRRVRREHRNSAKRAVHPGGGLRP